jgi:type IV pilus assembly protein PilP
MKLCRQSGLVPALGCVRGSAARSLVGGGRRSSRAALLAALLLAVGCGGEESLEKTTVKPPAPKGAAAAKAPAKPAASAAVAAAPSNLPPLPLREFREADLTESDQSRDPFRSFESLFLRQAKTRAVLQRQVLVDRFALDELKLAGVVTRGSPRAMLVDPTALGWIVQVGDFVGKAELVHAGGSTGGLDVAVNWRVDRIRESDVVFVREDPSHPEIPPTTRVLALRPEEQGPTASSGPVR